MNEELLKDLEDYNIEIKSTLLLDGGCGDSLTFKYDPGGGPCYQLHYFDNSEDEEKYITELDVEELESLIDILTALLKHTKQDEKK